MRIATVADRPHRFRQAHRKDTFFRVTELATLLLEAREERQLTRLRSQLRKPDLLVLDELGYVPASQVGAELLFDVISTAYERSSVVVTTNLPFEEWKEVLGVRVSFVGRRLVHQLMGRDQKASHWPASPSYNARR